MPPMTPDELAEFLQRPLIASLTTLRSDGSPHVAPIWFEHNAGTFACFTGTGSVKVRNLLGDPRVALSISTHDEPYRYVLIQGSAAITTVALASTAHSISVRYWGEERGSRFAQELLDEGKLVLLVITPTTVTTESAS